MMSVLIIAQNRSLMATEREVAEFVKKVKRDKAWMTDFNVERNYSSPFRVEELMEDWALTHSAVVQVCMVIRIGIQLCRKLSQKLICSRSVVNVRVKVNKF